MHCPKVDRTQQLHLSFFGVRRHPRVQTTMTYKGWWGRVYNIIHFCRKLLVNPPIPQFAVLCQVSTICRSPFWPYRSDFSQHL
jgi:hypothetical protein